MGIMVPISRILRTLVVMLGFATLPAGAQSIFKCVEGEAIAYQSAPCGSGQVQVRLAIAQATRAVFEPLSALPRVAPSGTSSAQMRGNAWPWRRTLTLGMSDDEVLNLAGWGIPSRIVRTRAAREWREEWIYSQSAAGEHRLQFVNATLVDISDKPPVELVARLASASPQQ
jgi:hypothetical protein